MLILSSQAKFLFANYTVMEAHYKTQHSQEIRVHAFPLYYEINYRYVMLMLMLILMLMLMLMLMLII